MFGALSRWHAYQIRKAFRKDRAHRHGKDIVLVSRLGVEIGADCIKTHYTGDKEGFNYIVRSTPVPIVIAGGPKEKGSDEEFLSMIEEAMSVGARGICIGRNVWQRENIKEMIATLSQIVHKR